MDCNGQKTGHKFTRLTAFVISDKEYQIKTAAVNHWADSKIKDLTSTIEVKDRDLLHYRTELETVRRKYDALDKAFNKLAEENDDLSAKNQTLKWDLEYSQSERERLELLCDELEKYRKAFDAITSLTSDQLNQLINNV
jgi:chromosome segregation ATPase